MDKEIYNIVFYKFNNNNEEKIQSCIFFRNGEIKNTTYQEGIKECVKLVKKLNIQSKEELEKIINNNYIHVVSKEELKKNYKKYLPEKSNKERIEKVEKEVKETEEENIYMKYDPIKLDEDDNYDEDEYDEYDEYYDDEYYENLEEYGYYINNNDYIDKIEKTIKKAVKTIKEKIRNIKNITISKKLASLGLSCAVALGTPVGTNSFTIKDSQKGNMIESNINTTNNKITLDILLDSTNNIFQKKAMDRLAGALYNNQRTTKTEKISFEEMVSIQMAYNTFTREEIETYFNGTNITENDLMKNYEKGSSKLVNEYILEDENNPINILMLFRNEDGRNFYNKYHELFLKIKNSTDENRQALLDRFNKQINEDFNDNSIKECFKISVEPIIQAVQTMYLNQNNDYIQNNNKLKEYINSNFKNINNYTKKQRLDETNPTYIEYKDAINEMLILKSKNNNTNNSIQEQEITIENPINYSENIYEGNNNYVEETTNNNCNEVISKTIEEIPFELKDIISDNSINNEEFFNYYFKDLSETNNESNINSEEIYEQIIEDNTITNNTEYNNYWTEDYISIPLEENNKTIYNETIITNDNNSSIPIEVKYTECYIPNSYETSINEYVENMDATNNIEYVKELNYTL